MTDSGAQETARGKQGDLENLRGQNASVVVDNVICTNDHGDSGQVMESRSPAMGYECPECFQQAFVEIHTRGGPDDE